VAIALFILIIACINFMNLSTARSANRAKEVGIRKVMGSFRSHLMRQFLTESICLTFISILLALLFAYLLLPVFNQLSLSDTFHTIPGSDALYHHYSGRAGGWIISWAYILLSFYPHLSP
jgi:putative ABC transport system permease protein